MDIPPVERPNVMASTAMPQNQQPPTVLERVYRLAADNDSIADALHGIKKTISALANITRRHARESFDIHERMEARHHGHVALIEAMAAREAEAEQRASRFAGLAETESRLRIEDAERHKAELARLTAAPVEITDKGRAAVAKPPKATAAKTPKKEVVLDPDGHPVSNRKTAAKKAS